MSCTIIIHTGDNFANLPIVSEPIALELRQKTGNIYLHAQIFTGIMYLAAAVCMWFLRAWKIGQIEEIAAEKEKRPEDIDAAAAEPVDPQNVSSSSRDFRSSLTKRLLKWEKV